MTCCRWTDLVNVRPLSTTMRLRLLFIPNLPACRCQAHRLIVGSNNLTEAGLFTNTEAGLQIDAAPNNSVIEDARHALAAWSDPETGLAKRLDQPLLNDLVSGDTF